MTQKSLELTCAKPIFPVVKVSVPVAKVTSLRRALFVHGVQLAWAKLCQS